MGNKQMDKPQEIQKINLEREVIKKVVFISTTGGGEKMLTFFISGRILELPVHPTCPAMLYTKENFDVKGRKALLDMLQSQKAVINKDLDDKIKVIKGI